MVYEDEKPSTKDIEKYRGEKEEELTDTDRALIQAENYMNKVIEYFRHIQEIMVCHSQIMLVTVIHRI